MKPIEWILVGGAGCAFAVLLVLLGVSVRQSSARITALEQVVASTERGEQGTEEEDLIEVAQAELKNLVCLYESGPAPAEGMESLTGLPRGYWECEEEYLETRVVLSPFSETARRIEHSCAYIFRVIKSGALSPHPRAALEFRRTIEVCNAYFRYRTRWTELAEGSRGAMLDSVDAVMGDVGTGDTFTP